MSFEIKEITTGSSDNIHTLVGRIYIPEGEVKGIFHIVHGMTEHIERYDTLMSHMAQNGYVAFGYDHLGHGKTARDDSELGFIAHKNGWKYLVQDVNVFGKIVSNLYPQKPIYLFGHSMGSFIVRLAAQSFGDMYEKLIICGTGGKNPLSTTGIMLTKIIGSIKGQKYISNLIINMAFGSYNKRFEGNSKYDWLTKELETIEKYKDDKFCTFKFTVSAMRDLISLNHICNKKSWYKEIRKDLPIFIISGSDDPVGNYGKGVKQVYNGLLKRDANVKLKLYENCRHEILNDTCRNEVLSDILNFIR